MSRYECVTVEGAEPYEIGENTEPQHKQNEACALKRARRLFDVHERMMRETVKAQMELEEVAEGWPEGRVVRLWRLRYTTSCTPDGKPCWVYHTLMSTHPQAQTRSLPVLTPSGIQWTAIEPPGELWGITVRSVADLPDDWMVKLVDHTKPLKIEEPILCNCPYCQNRTASICITDTIEEGHTVVSEAMRKILDEIEG